MEYTKNQISTALIKEIALQTKKYKKHMDKVDTMISDSILNVSSQLQLKPSYIISMFGISNIRKMLPIELYREIGYTS